MIDYKADNGHQCGNCYRNVIDCRCDTRGWFSGCLMFVFLWAVSGWMLALLGYGR